MISQDNPFKSLIKSKVTSDNPFRSLLQQKQEPPKSSVRGGLLGEVFTGNTQRFGKTVGESLAAGKNTDLYIEALEQHSQIRDKVLQKIKEKKRAGQDTTILEKALQNLETETPKLEKFTGDVINKTTGQIAGEALGTVVEATGIGALKGLKGVGLVKNVAQTANKANKARKAYQGLSFGKKALSIGKDTAKMAASTIPFGYAYDVSAGLQGQRGEDRTGANAFKPGMATAFSGALPLGVGAFRFGRQLSSKVLPHILSNLSGEPLEAYTRRQTGQLEPLIKGASKEKTLNVARDAVTKFRVGMIEDFGNSIENITKKYQGTRIGFDDINANKLKEVAEAFGFDMPQNVKNMSGKEVSEVLTYLSESYIPNASTLQDVKMNNIVKALRDSLKSKAITAFGGEGGDFAKMYQTYASKSDIYKEIAGVVGKVGKLSPNKVNTARNKLANIFKENNSAFLDAVKNFETATGAKILDQVAAEKISHFLPKTLTTPTASVLGWSGDLFSLMTFPLSSPRIGSWVVKQLSGMDEPMLSKLLDKIPGARKAIYDAVTKENMSFNNAVKKYIKNPQMGMSIKDVSGQSSRSPVNAWSTPKTTDIPTTTTNIQNNTANMKGSISQAKSGVKPYKGEKDLTTKILKDLEGKTTVSKQYILDATNRGELKQVERDLVRDVLEHMGINSTDRNIAQDFINSVRTGEVGGSKVPKAERLPFEIEARQLAPGWGINPELPPAKLANAFDEYLAKNKGKDVINVSDFAKKVKAELLPLKTQNLINPKYESITLPSDLRGNVKNYSENIYESPIKTSAGDVHFPSYGANSRRAGTDSSQNYFGHTRIEDMADNNTRRVIEVQSDLYQKGNLENERSFAQENLDYLKETGKQYKNPEKKLTVPGLEKRLKEVQKLEQYNDPTAHFRMIREEIKKASQDGKTKLQFPTGETAMKIEGLGENKTWRWANGQIAEPKDLEVGHNIFGGDAEHWIITDVLGDGKFKAVPKDQFNKGHLQDFLDTGLMDARMTGFQEQFDISGKVDTSNPIFKFYEKDVQQYLKRFGGTRVKDAQGVEWIEVPIKKEWAKMPVEAFAILGGVGLNKDK